MNDAIAAARAARDVLVEKINAIDAIRDEYSQWYDAMNEGWQNSEKGEKVSAIAEMDTDDSCLAEFDDMLTTIENAIGDL